MKKFLLVLAVFSMVCLNASAGEIVYSITGKPAYHIDGFGNKRDFNNFGSNATFVDKTPVRYVSRRGYARPCMNENGRAYAQPRMRNMIQPVQKPVQISRFDKGYQISTRKSYTKNGIIYFN